MNPPAGRGEILEPTASSISRNRIAFFGLVLALTLTFAAGCGHHNVSTATQPPAGTPVPVPQPAQPPASTSSGAPPASERQPAIAGQYVEEGIASWYGAPFDGHRTSNGEVYDMHQFTAAHRTLPFNAIVRVTNLQNGKQTEVRINDRGPFVGNRIIDLSLSAAQAIEMVGPGTAQVRLEIIAGPNPTFGFFGVQVGAFLRQDNAERLKAQLEATYTPVSIATYDSPNGLFYRVRVGRFGSEDAARQVALQLHASDQFTTFVVRLDD